MQHKPLEINPVETTVLDPFGSEAVPNTSVPPNQAKIMSEYFSQALSRDPREIEQEVLNGMSAILRNEVNGRADVPRAERVDERLSVAFENAEDPQAVLDELRGMRFGDFLVPQVSVLLEGGELADRELRMVDRIWRANEIIGAFEENQSKGIGATIGYFGDMMVSDPLQNIIGGLTNLVGGGDETFEESSKRRDLAREMNDLLMTDVSPEQFETEFSSILQRVADAGMFSNNNPFFMEEFLMMVQEGGEGATSKAATAFQVLDVATAGVGTALVRGSSRLGALPKSISRIKGRRAGVDAIVRSADEGRPSAIVAEAEPMLTRMANPDTVHLSAPDLDALRELEATNSALQFLRKNFAPAFTDPRILKAKMGDLVNETRAKVRAHKRHELDVNVLDDGLGNLIGRVVLGKSDRSLYSDASKAQEFANRIGGEVRATVDSGTTKYVVIVDTNLSTEGLARATSLSGITKGWLSGITSTTKNTTSYLDGVLKWGESSGARTIKTLGKQYQAVRSQTSRAERGVIDKMFLELRDDPLYSHQRGAYSRSEFIGRYTALTNDTPSQQALELWETIGKINDTDYYLNADPLLKEAVNNGETMLRLDDEFFRARKADVPDGEIIFDMDTQKFRDKKIDDAVFEVKDFAYAPDGVGAVRYVTQRNAVERRLFHTDVLNYNVGGHRFYTDKVEYFMKQEGSITLGDGTTTPRNPNTFMGVRTVEEARETMEGWNRIAAAVAADDPNLDAIARTNSRWHHGIENGDDFKRIAGEQGLNPAKPISLAADGEDTLAQGAKMAAWAGESTTGQLFRNGFANRARADSPLLGFGGDSLNTMNPTQAMERGFAGSLNRTADTAYLNQATKGLLRTIEKLEKRGENHVKNWEAVAGQDIRHQVKNLEFKNTDVGKKLYTEQQTILRVLDRTHNDLAVVQKALGNAANFVYRKKDSIPWIGDKASSTADWLAKQDYPGYIRSAAFHSKLGMLSMDQMVVQGSQSINAVAISSNTLGFAGAMRAASGAHPLQMALASENVDVIRRLAKAQASYSGVGEEDFIKLVDWVKKTGRGVIDRTVVEENRDAVLGAGTTAKIANLSTTFFRWGEVNARMAGAMLNMAELRATGFTGDIFSDSVTRRMIARQDILAASMTAKSAAAWQKSMLAIPLQFMTYNMRILEQTFSPDILTGGERIRLGITHLFMYGGAAVPAAGYYMDKYGYEGAYDPSTGVAQAIRYGAMDLALSHLIEAVGGTKETALSTRIGVGDGMFQFLEENSSGSLIDFVKGPGGQVISDTWSAVGYVADGLFSESWDATGYDLNRFARIFSSYDDGFKLWAASTYGEYWSRNSGTVTQTGLNTVDGIAMLLGIPLADQGEVWNTIKFERDRRENTEKVFDRIEEMSRLAARLNESKDDEGFRNVMDDIFFAIRGLPISDQTEARGRIRRIQDLPTSLANRIMRDGRIDLAERLRKDFE